jgi:hypothetical protein
MNPKLLSSDMALDAVSLDIFNTLAKCIFLFVHTPSSPNVAIISAYTNLALAFILGWCNMVFGIIQ